MDDGETETEKAENRRRRHRERERDRRSTSPTCLRGEGWRWGTLRITCLGFDAAYDKTAPIGPVWTPPGDFLEDERAARVSRVNGGGVIVIRLRALELEVWARGLPAKARSGEIRVGVAMTIIRGGRWAVRDRGIYVHHRCATDMTHLSQKNLCVTVLFFNWNNRSWWWLF